MSVLFSHQAPAPSALRIAVAAAHLADESTCVERLLGEAALDAGALKRVDGMARQLVAAVRQKHLSFGGLDAFLHEYDLSSQEGVVLMCLAEALLRIPDAETADRLIHDKLSGASWEKHLGHSRSLLVNASTWGLMLTGRLVRLENETAGDVGALLERLVARSGSGLVRLALKQAMGILAGQFVMGRTIEEALQRSLRDDVQIYRYSFDMLGEAALCRADAQRYFKDYAHALRVIAATFPGAGQALMPGVSVKLSALHPRFEYAQRERVMAELVPALLDLAELAAAADIGLTVDAEEAERLELTLDVFEAVLRHPKLSGWQGFGLVVQVYQKRAIPLLGWLADLARRSGKRIPLRLVKGAYWDSEIKRAQVQGLAGYPVFTRKAATDVSYLACARYILANRDAFFPQFATHNAHTVACVMELAGTRRDFEFQRLHGMGDALYGEISTPDKLGVPCRVYAPVGGHRELLPYLVRRLLENGANTSFVNRIADQQMPLETVIADPLERMRRLTAKPNPRLPLPRDLYGAWRNSAGISLGDPAALAPLAQAMTQALARTWSAGPLVGGAFLPGEARALPDPADHQRSAGEVAEADAAAVEQALALAAEATPAWDAVPAASRADCLERAADLIERHRAELMALLVREGGKCIPDALAEVREAADYCRYYASQARRDFGEALVLPGPAGESNRIGLHGRGVFACISPWNFPLAIFTGQVAAALAAGNAVIAKPASQTPLVAMLAVRLLHQAGVPTGALHLLPGAGKRIGMLLAADPRVAGIAFTGSTETAQAINRALAARAGAIAPLIAETGGQNAMIVDSSALPEQVVADVLQSAFNSAGQRCSALRVLFVQEEIAPRIISLLQGTMAELRIGDPALLSTDVGPVIDDDAKAALERHAARMANEGRLLYRSALPEETERGSFFPPCAFEIDCLERLEREVFGPILHIIRFSADGLDQVIDAINRTGYGLTFGIHSRIDETVEYVRRRVRAGNFYANRNMIGAVVGVQPFGGEGLSGTGPKAGGAHYLHRFAVERAVTVNTAAVGGNAALLAEGNE
jgi:RHH-type proline utilization regulon transcriptional repressor/proline dehydrogenase/delta 1-pyrroline-5-carboxylate dehydrogenase